MLYRKRAGNDGTSPRDGIDCDCSTVQLDERTHKRQAETGTTVLRAHGIRLEPVEHLIHRFRRDARPMVGDAEKYRIRAPLGQKRNSLAFRRKANSVGKQVE